MDTVYIETTIVGHLTGRVHPNLVIAGRQTTTREWWRTQGPRYKLFVSQLVFDECGGGDAGAARERLDAIRALDLLDVPFEVNVLARSLVDAGAVPPSEPRDAVHIAIAAVNGVKYLLTWNFKHIANVTLRDRIEAICRDNGFEPPLICTPDELIESNDDF